MGISSVEQDVLDEVERNWSRQREFLKRLVSIPSTLGHEAAAQRLVAQQMREMGLEVDLRDVDPGEISGLPGFSPPEWGYHGRPNACAVWRTERGSAGGRSLVFNGHVDVVSAHPEHMWRFPPFAATEEDGRLFGRGAADMKAGLSAMLFATAALRAAGVHLHGDLILQSVIEEECTGNGTLAALQRGYGGDGALIPEPFGQAALSAQVGVLWSRVKVVGSGAHVQSADAAVNAFYKCIPVVQRIRQYEAWINRADARHPAFRALAHPLNVNVGVVKSGDWPSTVPAECVLEVRIGLFPGQRIEEVKEAFRRYVLMSTEDDPWLKAHPPEVTFYGFHAPGATLDVGHPLFAVLGEAHQELNGQPLPTVPVTATTDARFFHMRGIPVTCYGPIGGQLHAPDEWVDLESVRAVTKVLALFAMRWCGASR